MKSAKLNTYKSMLEEMISSMEKAIGSHVVQILLEHAHWQTKERFEEAVLIKFSEEGIFIEDLENIPSEKAELVVYEFIMQIVSSLGRLVGKEMANKLTEYLQK